METVRAPFDSLYPENSRFEEIEKILGFIKEGNSCQLIGLPGTGRSNLLGFLAYNHAIRAKHLGDQEKQFHFVMINFSELKHRSLFDVTKIIFLTIVESLKTPELQPIHEKVTTIFKESLSYQDELILFQGLKSTIDILAVAQQLTIVLLFERFEEYVPKLTPDFFTNLRVLRNRAKYHFSVIFSLNRSLEELLEPSTTADFYELIAGHTIYLPISDIPGNKFRITYLEKATGKTIDPKTIETITEYTAGHGKLTRICVEILLSSPPDKGEPEGVEFFLQQKRIQGTLNEIWQALSPLEQACLSSDSPCDHEETDYLNLVGICNRKTISIPLLSAFAKEKAKELTATQKIMFNVDTNMITKGDLVLSDKLTVSEFRLLRFLIENQNHVVEKEDIIRTVWQDAKTTAGVTDQALDQLIFRLRKKIEDDPNIPEHIQTVKGRGVKFTS
ncbi:MAG TPA: helix-turn-helix domain-containing protein [Candidatus Saccharimonadales bacterium]|nr:helix-turn-helix domain-containing protein [Candidatus Saccharimonadales bacterium]